jgi:hypothetical protein
MGAVADFTQSETWAIENTLKQRWPKQPVELQLAGVEIKMSPDDRVLTEVPAVLRPVGDAKL